MTFCCPYYRIWGMQSWSRRACPRTSCHTYYTYTFPQPLRFTSHLELIYCINISELEEFYNCRLSRRDPSCRGKVRFLSQPRKNVSIESEPGDDDTSRKRELQHDFSTRLHQSFVGCKPCPHKYPRPTARCSPSLSSPGCRHNSGRRDFSDLAKQRDNHTDHKGIHPVSSLFALFLAPAFRFICAHPDNAAASSAEELVYIVSLGTLRMSIILP